MSHIVRLTHTHSATPNGVCIQTDMPIEELRKLIHLWQIKLNNEEETMDFAEEEMADILECFGCRKVNNTAIAHYDIDLYMIWECGVQTDNPKVTDDDLVDPEYVNLKALAVMNEVIARTREYYAMKAQSREA